MAIQITGICRDVDTETIAYVTCQGSEITERENIAYAVTLRPTKHYDYDNKYLGMTIADNVLELMAEKLTDQFRGVFYVAESEYYSMPIFK